MSNRLDSRATSLELLFAFLNQTTDSDDGAAIKTPSNEGDVSNTLFLEDIFSAESVNHANMVAIIKTPSNLRKAFVRRIYAQNGT